MAGKVKDLVESLKGPVHQELMKREGKRKSKVQFIPHDYKGESEPTQSKEGTDSEGKAKSLHLSMADETEGVLPDDETAEA